MTVDTNLRIQALHYELDGIQKQLRVFPRFPNAEEMPPVGLVYELLMNRMYQIIIELDKLEG